MAVAQGIADTDEFAGFGVSKIQGMLISEGHIGTDESGKGDYFKSLVIAGVYVEADDLPLYRKLA